MALNTYPVSIEALAALGNLWHNHNSCIDFKNSAGFQPKTDVHALNK